MATMLVHDDEVVVVEHLEVELEAARERLKVIQRRVSALERGLAVLGQREVIFEHVLALICDDEAS